MPSQRTRTYREGEDRPSQPVEEQAEVFEGHKPVPTKNKKSFGDLLPRVLSAVVFVVVVVGCLFLGNIPTMAVVCVLAGICAFEFFRMMHKDGRSPADIVGIVAACAYPVVMYFFGLKMLISIISIQLVALLIWYVFSPRTRIADVSLTVFGSLYCGLMISLLVAVRAAVGGLEGAILTFGVILSVWANDTFAYFVGSKLGRHKMVPKISPKKSWEGFFGGLIGSIIVWCLIPIFVPQVSWLWAVIAGLVCGVAGVFGDLVESRIKRGVGVKDSGKIMPGHGGMLDRCDSLIFVSFFAYVILSIAKII